jgi:hypothetical protein
MHYTLGNLTAMARYRIITAPSQDSDGDNEGWDDGEAPSLYRRTLNVIVSDRIDANERPLRPRTDTQERTRIAADERDNGWKVPA